MDLNEEKLQQDLDNITELMGKITPEVDDY